MLFPAMFLTFTVTVVCMIALRPLAFSVHLVDIPGGRKSHNGNVPLIGGLSMYAGLAIGISLAPGDIFAQSYLLLAAGYLLVIGILDDRYGIPSAYRMLAQLSSVLLMVYGGGFVLNDIGDPFGTGLVTTGPLALLITTLVAVAAINAFNVVDGIDGLAGTLASISLLAVALVGFIGGGYIALPLIALASISGFLLFNFPMIQNRRLLSFMGDAGSTMLGFVVVWATISICQGGGRLASPVICLWFVSVPIYDLFDSFVGRIRKGRSPFMAGRDHCHHTLQRGGFSSLQIIGILGGQQLFHACIGLAGLYMGIPEVVMFVTWSVFGLTHHKIILAISSSYRLALRRQAISPLAAASE